MVNRTISHRRPKALSRASSPNQGRRQQSKKGDGTIPVRLPFLPQSTYSLAVVLVMTVGMSVVVMVVMPVLVVLPVAMVMPLLVALPVAFVITTTLPPSRVPCCSTVWRASPASRIPDVAAVDGSPIALNPHEALLGRRRGYFVTYRRRRCADLDAN